MPQNAGYYHAAYIIVAVVYGAYALSLWLRLRGGRRRGKGASKDFSVC
jgi:hypothetical protein